MNYLTLILVLLIAIYLWWKWILFIIIAPLISFKAKRKMMEVNDGGESTEQPYVSEPTDKSTHDSRLKTLLSTLYFGFIRYITFQIGYIPSHSIRDFIYKKIFGVRMGEYAIIYFGAELRSPEKLIIGKGSIIGDKAILDARNGIIIGDNVNFSSEVHIWTEQHDHRDPLFRCTGGKDFRVKIGNRAWIGPGVTILHSVNIGEGAVIAAGAIVTKDIPPYAIAAGIPAKVIGKRTDNLKYELTGKPAPFY